MLKRQKKALDELRRRREVLLKNSKAEKPQPVGDEAALHQQIEDLERMMVSTEELWSQHQLDWTAHRTELRRRLVYNCAHIMIAFDTEDTRKPDRYILKPGVLVLLHWWRDEGGREEYLGELPLEDRRKLETMEREWRTKEP